MPPAWMSTMPGTRRGHCLPHPDAVFRLHRTSPCSRPSPMKCFIATQGTGSPGRSTSTGATAVGRSCRGSRDGQSPTSRAPMSESGSRCFTQRPWQLTAPCRFSPPPRQPKPRPPAPHHPPGHGGSSPAVRPSQRPVGGFGNAVLSVDRARGKQGCDEHAGRHHLHRVSSLVAHSSPPHNVECGRDRTPSSERGCFPDR